MKSRDFCYWLQGFCEIAEGRALGATFRVSLDESQCDMVKRHLALVFQHEIDPLIDGGDPATKAKLDATHSDRSTWPDGQVMRC